MENQNNKEKKSEKPQEKKSAKKEKQSESTDHITYWKIWYVRNPYKIPTTQYTLKGYSVAALRTNFYIKELGLMLDGGLSAPNMTINHMLITHPHSDHTANIPFHIYAYKEPDKIQIYVPKGIEKHLKEFIESAYLLSSHTFPEEENIKREELFLYSFFDLVPVEAGQLIPIYIKKNKFYLEIFQCYHQVPCVGYGIYEVRKKLKEEYSKLSGKEIGELRKKGIEINYESPVKFLCYLGDTSKKIFEGEQWHKITQYKNIIIECTFIKEEELEQADKTNHIHWFALEPIIDKYKDNNFILIHFSQRYDNSELEAFFKEKNKSNVYPWIN